ncbi:MAG: hypothetical protein DFNUSKGM_001439 [Candidatus Fervidibacter sacchari]
MSETDKDENDYNDECHNSARHFLPHGSPISYLSFAMARPDKLPSSQC